MRRKPLWTPAALALLGTTTDGEIAKRLRCSVRSVIKKRTELGIASPGRTRWTWKWGPWELGMIGKETDAEVVRITGRSLSEVVAKRRELKP